MNFEVQPQQTSGAVENIPIDTEPQERIQAQEPAEVETAEVIRQKELAEKRENGMGYMTGLTEERDLIQKTADYDPTKMAAQYSDQLQDHIDKNAIKDAHFYSILGKYKAAHEIHPVTKNYEKYKDEDPTRPREGTNMLGEKI